MSEPTPTTSESSSKPEETETTGGGIKVWDVIARLSALFSTITMPVAVMILVWVVDLRRDVGIHDVEIVSLQKGQVENVEEDRRINNRIDTFLNPPEWLLERLTKIELAMEEIRKQWARALEEIRDELRKTPR